MKKNKFMKLASGLLVLCLMTTCVIGATLAKYTTAKEVSDQARVAKWGVKVTVATDPAFQTTYATNDTVSYGEANSVVSSKLSEKVVAPGTSGTATAFSITGTPEVAAKVTFKMTAIDGEHDVKDIVLKSGTYTNYAGDSVIVANDYYPVVFTLKKDGVSEPVVSGTLAQVAAAVNGLSTTINPGAHLEDIGKYTVTWAWAFETGANDTEKANNNKADTILGDLAAGVLTGIDSAKYSTEVEFKISITVTQID